jgi:hypothetical protein
MQSGGKFIALLLILLALAGVLFLVFGGRYAITKPLYDKVFAGKGEEVVQAVATIDNNFGKNIVEPPKENDWCKIQEIPVTNSNEGYTRDRILGWDPIEKCCARRVDGYNCALHNVSYVEYCYTANVGGVVKWVLVDGYFVSNDNYMPFIRDLDKGLIENKPCDAEKYPAFMRPTRNITAEYNPQ